MLISTEGSIQRHFRTSNNNAIDIYIWKNAPLRH
jgi:hypothetical protein